MARHMFSNAQIKEAKESCNDDDRCAYKWMFMAQERMLETMADESMTLFVKTRDLSATLGDIAQQLFDIQQEMRTLNLRMNQLSYYKNREDKEDRLYE
jgi:hypothetical protein|tara:strand:- start:280 stop:573 length:294 start_codon:yes stop_codon:yes gene_type:complete